MEQPKIEWRRMGWRWWLEATGKLTALIALFSTASFLIGDDQPRWVFGAVIFGCFIVGVMLIPTFPREGEDDVSFKDALLGTGWMIGIVIGLAIVAAIAIAVFVVVPEIARPVLQPFGDWLETHFTLNTALLILIAYLQFRILDRLSKGH